MISYIMLTGSNISVKILYHITKNTINVYKDQKQLLKQMTSNTVDKTLKHRCASHGRQFSCKLQFLHLKNK